jgi:hypothetical protein
MNGISALFIEALESSAILFPLNADIRGKWQSAAQRRCSPEPNKSECEAPAQISELEDKNSYCL